ncbi:MAG: hypothetical protein JWP59_222 [Massilia sp.]|jgi:curved DNA-binding protein CbpA|nr:hypothetical protein [Massilia sp.]
MRTLYDVLGLSRSASTAQVETAYRTALAELGKTGTDADDMIRAKAIGEAYSILGSPTRREAYDARLRHKETAPVTIVVEEKRTPWLPIIALAVVLVAALTYYKVQAQRTAAAAAAVEAITAAAAAAEAARLQEAVESRQAQQVLNERRRAEEQRRREIAMARMEPRVVYVERETESISAERRREQTLERIKAEQRNEEMLARQRIHEQTIGMQRALDIPIVKH